MQSVWLEGLELLCSKDRATLGGRQLELSHMERQLLLFLAQNPGETLTRERLLREVWGYAAMGATRTIAVSSTHQTLPTVTREGMGGQQCCVVTDVVVS